MRRDSFDLLSVMLFAAVSFVLALPGFRWVPARIILAIPMVFVIPGYVVVCALFPRPTFKLAEQALLSISGSITLAILAGFALYWTPWGLQATSLIAILTGITFVAYIVAVLRRNQQATFTIPMQPKYTSLHPMHILSIAAACFIFVGAIVIARTPVSASNVQGYSQLWVLPANQTNQSVRLGVRSEEFADVEYRVEVRIGNAIVHTWPSIELKPGQQWEATTDLPTGRTTGQDVVVQLYRLDVPDTVYRRVVLRAES